MTKRALSCIPNLLTMGNICCGFLAILFAVRGEHYFLRSMLMMLVAGLFDFFDGFAARKLGVSSDVGRELDSLADVVSFGVAPAILLYERALQSTQWFGIIAVALYVCCGAWRLARHNVLSVSGRKSYFTGMPIEGGTALLLAVVLSTSKHITDHVMVGVALAAVIIGGFLMVSTLRFTAEVPWVIRLGALAIMVIGFVYPGVWTMLIPLSYIAYGVVSNFIAVNNDEAASVESSLVTALLGK